MLEFAVADIISIAKTGTGLLACVATGLACLVAAPAQAHHSYSMYDGSVYRVFTGVMVRVIPNAAHFEMHFVPLNEERNALVRDDNGDPLVWVVQMESAFPKGTVISMGVHPRRDGRPAGDRGESGLFRCPEGRVPKPGKHCDSVEGAMSFGPGILPEDGEVLEVPYEPPQ